MTNTIFLIAVIPCAILGGLGFYGAIRTHYHHKHYKPIFDHDKNQAVLDNEFAPLPSRKEPNHG